MRLVTFLSVLAAQVTSKKSNVKFTRITSARNRRTKKSSYISKSASKTTSNLKPTIDYVHDMETIMQLIRSEANDETIPGSAGEQAAGKDVVNSASILGAVVSSAPSFIASSIPSMNPEEDASNNPRIPTSLPLRSNPTHNCYDNSYYRLPFNDMLGCDALKGTDCYRWGIFLSGAELLKMLEECPVTCGVQCRISYPSRSPMTQQDIILEGIPSIVPTFPPTQADSSHLSRFPNISRSPNSDLSPVPNSTATSPPSYKYSLSPTPICKDDSLYRSPLNANFGCEIYCGTNCFLWNALLNHTELQEMFRRCPVTCNVPCSSTPSYQPSYAPSMSIGPSHTPSNTPTMMPTCGYNNPRNVDSTPFPSKAPVNSLVPNANSSLPSVVVSSIPSNIPNTEMPLPTTYPSRTQSFRPIFDSSSTSSLIPSSIPSKNPTMEHSSEPSTWPSSIPSSSISSDPLYNPSPSFPVPSLLISSNHPSTELSPHPSERPSYYPPSLPVGSSRAPTVLGPSLTPSETSTNSPNFKLPSSPFHETSSPFSVVPSYAPSDVPNKKSLSIPTVYPSEIPSFGSSFDPSSTPIAPFSFPNNIPTVKPSSGQLADSFYPSLSLTETPSFIPSNYPSTQLSQNLSEQPSLFLTGSPSAIPSLGLSTLPSKDLNTTLSSNPTDASFKFTLPSVVPHDTATVKPTCYLRGSSPSSGNLNMIPSTRPISYINSIPSINPSSNPFEAQFQVPNIRLSSNPSTEYPSINYSTQPTLRPTMAQTLILSSNPESSPSLVPSRNPVVPRPCGMAECQRSTAIFTLLDQVSDPVLLRTPGTPHSRSIQWLLNDDDAYLCPDNAKIIQRYVMALLYFSTNGEEWFQCSSSPLATDSCGDEDPFEGQTRFLSSASECNWAGIRCDTSLCVTQIEFEGNNLVGTIPYEIAELKELEYWGMERGNLVGKIPTTISALTNLFFIDLDYNQLTGTLPHELFSLTKLKQLDLNDNLFSGSIAEIEMLNNLRFLQLHQNKFSGTIPIGFGNLTNLRIFTVHTNELIGEMPYTVCSLKDDGIHGGLLSTIQADCMPQFNCSCCTNSCPSDA